LKKIHIVISCLLFFAHSILAQNLKSNTTGVFSYTPPAPLDANPIEVYYHIPNGIIVDMPVLMSFHGSGRNADDYRDYWVSMSDEHKFIVLAPKFDSTNWTIATEYITGNVFSDYDDPSENNYNNQNEWTYSIIDNLFDYVIEDISGNQLSYIGWGHSAGAQFLHRFVMYLPNSKLNTAICSNAGWYLVPENGYRFPYGLDDSQISNQKLESAFSKKLFIHLGKNDINPNSSGLRRNATVDTQQGKNRYVRGKYFFETSLDVADDFGYDFNWEKYEVIGVGHESQKMANEALKFVLQSSLSKIDISISKTVDIYPIPINSNYINILKKNLTTLDITVYDFSGKEIYQTCTNENSLFIPNIVAGVYFMKIESALFSVTKKFSKK
tara:strand:+ start:851 stop:1999 length:1149 start_codon:yes stop_codon:yes gene_type:complete